MNGIPQFMWPDHCVQGTPGAEFHPALNRDKATHIIQKGKTLKLTVIAHSRTTITFMKTGPY